MRISIYENEIERLLEDLFILKGLMVGSKTIDGKQELVDEMIGIVKKLLLNL